MREGKVKKLVVVIAVICLVLGYAFAQGHRRFEITEETTYDGGLSISVMSVHDTGSGVELLCVRGANRDGIYCTPTGRNWK